MKQSPIAKMEYTTASCDICPKRAGRIQVLQDPGEMEAGVRKEVGRPSNEKEEEIGIKRKIIQLHISKLKTVSAYNS